MRIAFISYEFPPDTGKGGIGTYVAQTARFLSERGIEVHVFAGSGSGNRSEAMDGYSVHRVLCSGVPDFREKVVTVFTERQEQTPFDCMESPEIGANALELKKKFPQLPLIVRLHAPDHLVESLKKYYVPCHVKLRFFLGALRRFRWDLGYWRKYDPIKDLDYRFTLMAEHITAPSSAMKDWVVRNWPIEPGRIRVFPNLFFPDEKWLLIPIEKGTPYRRIVFLGRLNVLKGMVNATRAMKRILLDYPEWRFRVIGEDGPGPSGKGSMRNWMERELRNVIDRVEFMGGLDYAELPAVVAACEIVLLPSLFESFSYTCVEAMAAGKAVVGSRSGGMADLLENGNTGLLVNPFRPDAIERAVRNLVADTELRTRISHQARIQVLNRVKSLDDQSITLDFYRSVSLHN